MIDVKINLRTERQIIKQVVRTAGFLVILILISGNFNILRGYLFGLVISLLMFFRLASTTKKALEMSEKKAKSYIMVQYLIRYLIYAGTLAVAYKRQDFSFGGAIIGLLTIKIGLLSWAFWQVLVNLYESKFKTFLKKP
ncbi:hypothetical protein BBF96_11730 [Anoxybacter fermentans]|uniref:ATP synthase subunit I n=1 Tax=Anoxybacter fermentans TaxID=1323375 RepID=A0A3Q9HRV1_9FIRM|nr:ATP synthase subunit I [Anoxybacter fermentans]AZR74003.1 hypothetical protein BBF96_11730 [Anoxybacter fermentans]